MKEDFSSNEKSSSRLALLAGDASYSLSPFIHEKSAELLSRKTSYQGLSFNSSTDLSSLLESFKLEGVSGFNVTNPFKKKVAGLIDCAGLPSVNTVSLSKDGSWKGYSTDGEGFYRSMNRYGYQFDSFDALCFFGNGDVLFSLLSFLKEKIKDKPIYFIRRSCRRDDELRAYSSQSAFLPFEPASLERVLEKHDGGNNICLIQATSAPTHGKNLEEFVPKLSSFEGVFCDLLYSQPSKMYEFLKKKGERVLDGLPMLIDQALLSQEIWWGESAPYEVLKQELESYLKGEAGS